ncbi:AP-3 complex subunit sigma-1 isoform X1 [Cyclopterus lumpus]|uniref:AP-3 complex subunit sigma-1 isoform X1 n=1 Tax=Cyclopterus lumpus TaxID=8103 RepID=UPI0014872E97|nr:AP-3 complex subunit sigma-1 isoform X1 [Cyclopterus lumpus]
MGNRGFLNSTSIIVKTRSNRSSGKPSTWSRKEMRTSVTSSKVECKLGIGGLCVRNANRSKTLELIIFVLRRLIGGSDYRLIYRHYATLYFVFCVDSSESELGILDLIQVFVETLDKCFENVCELDLIFHVDKVHNILAEMVMGGMVLETNMNEIITQVDSQNKMEKSEAGIAGAPARAVSAVKNMNLPEMPRNINIGDISIKVPNLPSFK